MEPLYSLHVCVVVFVGSGFGTGNSRSELGVVLGMVRNVVLVVYSGVCIRGRIRVLIYVDVNNPPLPSAHPPSLFPSLFVYLQRFQSL